MSATTGLRSDQRRRICIAVLGGIFLSVLAIALTAEGPDAISGRLGGDYPAFHAAGDVVRESPGLSADVLYDPAVQAEAQAPYRAEPDGQLYFAYPAFFVVPYVAMSALGFTTGYLVHTGLMAALLGIALWLIRPCSRIVRDHFLEVFTASLTFFPVFRGVTGGQNTALSILLVAVVWRMLHDDREGMAGLAVGLLLFKPPFALPFLGVLLLTRRWTAAGASLLTASGLYGLATLVTDPGWPGPWVDALRFLDEFDTPFNVTNFVSVPGFAEAVFGIDSTLASIVGYGVASALALAISLAWWRASRSDSERSVPVGQLVVTTAVVGVLISPHALYYDAGLLVLAGILLVDQGWPGWTVAAGWLGGLLHFLSVPLGADPLMFLVLAVGLALLRGVWVASLREPSTA